MDIKAEDHVGRRRTFLEILLHVLGFFAAGSIMYPILRYLVPPERSEPDNRTINVTAAADVKPNSGMIFPIGNQPEILIRTPKGELRAFTVICTYLGCTVQYRSDIEEIWCACHNGYYDLQGSNIAGPLPRPLKKYVVSV